MRRAFRHAFAIIAERIAPPQPTARRGRKGKGGNGGGWRAYARKPVHKPGIAALHHQENQAERAAQMAEGLRQADAATSKPSDAASGLSRTQKINNETKQNPRYDM